jgi:membrane-bound metal-dependent hydrolase YbcI (DUF457 family)
MDNLTHGAFGIVTGWVRKVDPARKDLHTDRAVPWATFLAAEAPDLDVFIRRIPGLEGVSHRGITHTLIAVPFTALAAALLCKLLFPRARFPVVAVWAAAGMLVGHLFADVITFSGIRPFLPWSQARVSYEIIPFIDLNFSLPLLLVVIAGLLKPAWRRPLAIGLAALAIAYFGARFGSLATMKELTARPTPVPTGHRLVSSDGSGIVVREARFWAPRAVVERRLPRPGFDPAVEQAALSIRSGNRFLRPAVPYYLVEQRGDLRRVTVVDLLGRFAIGSPWAEIDPAGRIVRTGRAWFVRW